ncbi:hypothetical protein ACEQ8H_008017 [Pleosporales sp. CAS-2024a]
MPSNVFSTMAARAKAHHDSVNAAYQATYSLGTPGPSAPAASRKSSTSSVHGSAPAAQQSNSNMAKAWKAIKRHHAQVNEAYAAFYFPGGSAFPSRTTSAAATPKTSCEESRARVEGAEHKPRNLDKVWGAIKKKAVEHHRSVNAAAAAFHV